MLNNTIKCLKNNLPEEVLIVYSADETLIGECFINNSDEQIEIQFGYEIDNLQSNSKYIQINKDVLDYVESGDILLVRPNGTVQIIFSKSSQDNVLFLTEQCNNHCLMCSQPPKRKDDVNYFYWLNSKLIDLLPLSLQKIGITGGEPTLLKERLVSLLSKIKNRLPEIEVQLLSNGRNFDDINYVHRISEIGLKKLLIGVPLHSDFYIDHDYIAQNNNAFNQTLKGLYNLARYNFNIELRVVINKINYYRLHKISEYIFKNLPFVYHVAFMGLEYTGLVPKNSKEIWIDPIDYKDELKKSVLNLASWGMNVSIFNLPLCLIDESLYTYTQKSISDWKIKYFEQCENCILKSICGGDFGTSLKYSPNIMPRLQVTCSS
jgi:His-Xaa-Ser system radical SAM maturase HxsC